MKSILRFCILIFLGSCGTTGHVKFYDFNNSKYEIEKNLIEVINRDSTFEVPPKWIESTTGDVFKMYYVYFHQTPEELYMIGFTGDSAKWKQSPTCRLGLIGVYDGIRWRFESDLSQKEERRIQRRFEESILSKLKYYFTISD
jgi:hypothetical protein